MHTRRHSSLTLLLIAALITLLSSVSPAAAIRVGGYFINTEGVFTSSAPTYSAPLALSAQTRLAVQVAPQFAIDFGIISAADLKAWKKGQPVAFLARLRGQTNTRYITLNAGNYYVVAKDLQNGLVPNGYAFKVRRFNGTAKDGALVRQFVGSQIANNVVYPGSWQGALLTVPKNAKIWLQGSFSRGADQRVRYEILTGDEYTKFTGGQPHKALLSGTDPKLLSYEFLGVPGFYYFIVFNQGATYSSFAFAREAYR